MKVKFDTDNLSYEVTDRIKHCSSKFQDYLQGYYSATLPNEYWNRDEVLRNIGRLYGISSELSELYKNIRDNNERLEEISKNTYEKMSSNNLETIKVRKERI